MALHLALVWHRQLTDHHLSFREYGSRKPFVIVINYLQVSFIFLGCPDKVADDAITIDSAVDVHSLPVGVSVFEVAFVDVAKFVDSDSFAMWFVSELVPLPFVQVNLLVLFNLLVKPLLQ